MFETVDDIYNYIGQAMFDALPENWDRATFYALIVTVDKAMQSKQTYLHQGQKHDFDVNIINGVAKRTKCSKAFYSLYRIMQKGEKDLSWNKARFQITSEGDFEIDFKYDEDFEWYKALDVDSKEYDDLDIDIIHQIKSWEGLSDDAPRHWKQ